MNPDDLNDDFKKVVDWTSEEEVNTQYTSESTTTDYNLSWTSTSNDDTWNINFAEIPIDRSYGIEPEKDNPEIYTCHEQREQHNKYPALKKIWEDYLAMYNLTKGNPPIVD